MRGIKQKDLECSTDRLLNAREVARILNVSTAWVYDHADRKRPMVPSVRLGKALRFRPEDVQQFINEMTRRVA
jgi:predicted DNA-binding transcriptional regulator AlpA